MCLESQKALSDFSHLVAHFSPNDPRGEVKVLKDVPLGLVDFYKVNYVAQENLGKRLDNY